MENELTRMVREIKETSGWTNNDMARELSASPSLISGWLTGTCAPTSRYEKRIRALYDAPYRPRLVTNNDNYISRLNDILQATGWSHRGLGLKLSYSESAVSGWLTGRWRPDGQSRARIDELYAQYVKTTVDTPRMISVADVYNAMGLDEHPNTHPEDHTTGWVKTPEEAPENLNEVIDMNKTENLAPTTLELLNPPDVSAINQAPINRGYELFLENLRFFMTESRWDTDEKLETYLNLKPGYISEFGTHADRFEELLVIGEICDLIGIPWSVLAFSVAAKEAKLAKIKQRIEELHIELANLDFDRIHLETETYFA